jgi:excisionase family DNA binding protein
MQPRVFYPIKNAARHLGISVWTLRRKVYRGEVTSVKIGVKVLIPSGEIDRLIREGTRPRRIIGGGVGYRGIV